MSALSMNLETNRRRRLFRVARRAMAVLSLVVVVSMLSASTAMAQTPSGVEGPWLDIFQIFWFTDTPNYDHTDKGTTYAPNAAQRYDYGQNRHPQCYYYEGGVEPDADWINALYDMMSCRVGLVTGAITWMGVGIALMALAWGGLMWVVDSNSGGDRAGALRNMITGPLVGLTIMFLSYTFAKFLYTVIRYNFEKYLNPDVWT